MNLTLDDAQRELRDLARSVLAREVTPERHTQVDETDDRFDHQLWRTFADTGLLAVGMPEQHGGLGLGVVGSALVCTEVGRTLAAVPFAAGACAALVLTKHGSEEQQARLLSPMIGGETVVVVAPPLSGRRAWLDERRLSGSVAGVPWAHVADLLVLSVDGQVLLLDPTADGVRARRGETTAREIALDLELDAVDVETVGGPDAAAFLLESWLTLLAATQAGVTDTAVRMTADYTSGREQFGRPLSTFQAVALQAADAYLDARIIDAVALQAAWSLDAGIDATPAALTAAWWASEAGQHCVHVTQHLHGGIGADVTYPVHRYFLWGKQIELMCGAAAALLADLGDALVQRPQAGDALDLSAPPP